MAAYERKADQSDVKEILSLAFAILKVLLEGVLVIAWTIGNNWPDLSDRIISPDLESFVELFAVDGDVVIN